MKFLEVSSISKEYIDIDDALSRIGGNMSLYKKLLGRFVEGNHFEELERIIQSGDMEEAARQVHSIKGVSANLSLVKIRALSIELEQLIKGNADYSSCLGELKQAFSMTMDEINELQ